MPPMRRHGYATGTCLLSPAFHPDAEEVFVIGYGSGTTAGASLLFPGTFVTCSEIEPYVIEAGRFFRNVNYSPNVLRATNSFSMMDAVTEGSGNRYDLIISNLQSRMAGISNLFTVEFYRRCRAPAAGWNLYPVAAGIQYLH